MASRHRTDPARCRPVGLFDSGIGGLTVLREVLKELPHECLIYFGDTAHVPYGTKSKETITRFSVNNTAFLGSFDVKMVIVACNTASSLSLEALKRRFPMPIVDVIEPGAREALRVTRNGRVGIIGTKATIGSGSYEACLKELDPSVKVFSQACPLFVPLAEEGWFAGRVVSGIVETYLRPLKTFKVDTLILGCTHYPLLSDAIARYIGRGVRLVNSAGETAKAAGRLLRKLKLDAPRRGAHLQPSFYVSDEPESFRTLGERFLGRPISTVAKVGDFLGEKADGLVCPSCMD